MPEKELSVGDIIESQCRKCSDRTGHTIVSLVDNQVAKVECRACGSVHKHHPAKSETKAKAAKTSGSGASSSGGSQKKGKTAKAKEKKQQINEEWLKQIESKDKSKAVDYAMQAGYAEEDLIDHPHFGLGIVQKLIMPNKMEVLFKEGVKRLRCDLTEEENGSQG